MFAQAAAEIEARGLEPVRDPARLLQSLAGESVALKNVLRTKVDELALVHSDKMGQEHGPALLGAYSSALRDATVSVEKLVKLGVQDLIVDRDLKNAKVVTGCLDRAIYSPESDLSEEQVATIWRLFTAEMRRAFPDADETD